MELLFTHLNKKERPYGLAIFRICFGLLLLLDLCRITKIELLASYYPRGIVFPYEFSLPLVPEYYSNLVLVGIGISLICITLGVYFRIASFIFFLLFSYFTFLDQVLYNNHLYLVCLMAFLFVFIPADSVLSIKSRKPSQSVPIWCYQLLLFQIVLVYFFGGLSKLNPYWLNFQPVEVMLTNKAEITSFQCLKNDLFKYFITYGGIIFDLSIGITLLFKKTRLSSIIVAIVFNLLNAFLFEDIYIFPFLMISALILFVDQQKLYEFLGKVKLVSDHNSSSFETVYSLNDTKMSNSKMFFIFFYMLLQLALPLRHYFIPGYVDWTGDGQRFAWRMKIQSRTINEVSFELYDLGKKTFYEIKPEKHLYPDEITQMVNSPKMIVQFAKYLEKVALHNGIKDCKILSKVNVTFNNSEPLYIFDPDLDLLEINGRFYHKWVNPLPSFNFKN